MTEQDYNEFKDALIIANRDIEKMKISINRVYKLRAWHKAYNNDFTKEQLDDIQDVSKEFLSNEYLFTK